MKRLKHLFCHAWSEWKITDHGIYRRGGRVVGKFVLQRRECGYCKLTQMKTECAEVE